LRLAGADRRQPHLGAGPAPGLHLIPYCPSASLGTTNSLNSSLFHHENLYISWLNVQLRRFFRFSGISAFISIVPGASFQHGLSIKALCILDWREALTDAVAYSRSGFHESPLLLYQQHTKMFHYYCRFLFFQIFLLKNLKFYYCPLADNLLEI
jgi:hypothetical protein